MRGNKTLTVRNVFVIIKTIGEKYPCYKVVNSKGELSRAYAFGGIDQQKRRLEAEGITVKNGKVDVKKYGYGDVVSLKEGNEYDK